MSNIQEAIFNEVLAERKRQDAKWGGAEHDDRHSKSDWQNFILVRVEDFIFRDSYRRTIIEVAALAFAAIESFDRITRDTPENQGGS